MNHYLCADNMIFMGVREGLDDNRVQHQEEKHPAPGDGQDANKMKFYLI